MVKNNNNIRSCTLIIECFRGQQSLNRLSFNKNVDIHLVRITRFWNNLHHVTLKVKLFGNEIVLKSMGTRKPKGIKRTAKLG